MRRDDDLRTEVQFHIDMRIERHVKDGLPRDEAAALARQQFGDVEAVMTDMRRAHPRSNTALVAMVSALVITALWIYTSSLANAPVTFPGVADVPRPMTFVKRPPPPRPGPGPTWEEFVAKVNTFGDGSARSRRR
jgi:hypothetical protein